MNSKRAILYKLIGGLILLTGLFPEYSLAKEDCRSQIGASLNPLGKETPFYWGFEIIGGYGLRTNAQLANINLYQALSFNHDNYKLYVETGYKWRDKNFENHEQRSIRHAHFGARALYASFYFEHLEMTTGLFEASLKNSFILDERVVGIDIKSDLARWQWQLSAGSILKDFARHGAFCSVSHLLKTTIDDPSPLLGNKLGDMTFAAFSWQLIPRQALPSEKEDEFEDFNEPVEESAPVLVPSKLKIEGLALHAYSEFGRWIKSPSYFNGITLSIGTPLIEKLTAESWIQIQSDQWNSIHKIAAEKSLGWQQSAISCAYYTYWGDHYGHFTPPSFSNLFLGEMAQLDVIHLPLLTFNLFIPVQPWKTNIQFEHIIQLEHAHTRETDLMISHRFFGKMMTYFWVGRLSSQTIDETYWLTRLELHWTL